MLSPGLLNIGGFPEPFLNGTQRYYNRWKRSHIDLILKEDLITLTAVREIQSIETLIEMLRSRVGSTISANSLARDLQKKPRTQSITGYGCLQICMSYSLSCLTNRTLPGHWLKQPKYYFYDNGMVTGNDGSKLENLVACALLKEIHRLEDVEGEKLDLHFIRDKDEREIDFVITRDRKPHHFLEVKWADKNLSVNLPRFLSNLTLKRTQIVAELEQAKSFPGGMRVVPARSFLCDLPVL